MSDLNTARDDMYDEQRNQCDGCARGLPLHNGIHRGEGYDLIGCTKGRYVGAYKKKGGSGNE